jgi:hypothetical protein
MYEIPTDYKSGAAGSNPANTNLLNPTNFKFSLKRVPNLAYFCLGVSLPGWTHPTINIPTGVPGGKAIFKTSSESVSHGEATFRFLVNEDMSNYNEVFKWAKQCAGLNDFAIGNDQKVESLSWRNWMSEEGYLLILSNRKKPLFRITFRGLFPTSISDIVFKANETEATPITATVNMAFTYYSYESLYNS